MTCEKNVPVETIRQEAAARTAFKTMGTLQDVARLALCRAWDEARSITAQSIGVDARWAMR